jgi:hypothetical protein
MKKNILIIRKLIIEYGENFIPGVNDSSSGPKKPDPQIQNIRVAGNFQK